MSLLFHFICTLLNLALVGVLQLFLEFKYDWWLIALGGGLLLFLLVVILFACLGCKQSSKIANFRKRLYARKRDDPDFIEKL